MIRLHKIVLERIQQEATKNNKHAWVSKYLGTPHLRYGVKSQELKQIAKDLLKQKPDDQKLIFLIDSLFFGKSFEEKVVASLILLNSKKVRPKILPEQLGIWLSNLSGWAEVDSLCQNVFTDQDMLENWPAWEAVLEQLNKSKDINKRRASLVLLKTPVSSSSDPRFSHLAFKNIDNLKTEKDILITKAISWLLRCLIKNHKAEVGDYLKANHPILPKIALRETLNKLQTGKK